MLNYTNGDLVKEKKFTVFCHQVNCMGVMGSGIARQIRDEYPEVYREYKFHVDAGIGYLGTNLYVHTHDNRLCVNMFGQYNYGRDKQHTSYIALKKCLDSLQDKLSQMPEETIVGFPWKIGCGLGGGDWTVVEKMLTEFSYNVKQKVYIVKKIK